MVFQIRLRYTRIICVAVMVIFFLLFCAWQITSAKRFFIVDNRLSDFTKEEIKNNLFAERLFPKQMLEIVDKKYAIKNVDVRRLSSQSIKITAQALDPLYRITNKTTGQKFVLTEKKIVNQEHYLPIVLEYLPTITLDLQGSIFDEQLFINTCILLPQDLFDTYDLIYKNKTDIQLVSKKQQLIIVADNETILDREKISYAEFLAEKKYSKWVTIDIRFAHGAVCTPKGR